jgi:uncharacterized protein (DUF433 family)
MRRDVSGALRVGHSRVLVDLVIRTFQDGATPEAIVQRYPTTTLADMYAVTAYYLHHWEDIEAHLRLRPCETDEEIVSMMREIREEAVG